MTARSARTLAPFLVMTMTAFAPGAAPPDGQADGEARAALRAVIGQATQGTPAADGPRPLGADAAKLVDAWVKSNAAALAGLKPSGLVDQPWGLSALRPGVKDQPSLLYLYVFDWHVSGTLIVYGMTSNVKHAYFLRDASKAPLPVERRVRSTFVTVPKKAPDRLATVVVLELQGELEWATLVVFPAAEGPIIRLHGRDAIVHGRTLRYEPEPRKNTLGYWTDPADFARWEFEVTKPGTYAAEILQGCGKGSGGSKVEFGVGEQVLKVTVEDTGGFQNFVTRDIGRYRFDAPGRYTLTVKPVEKPGAAVMDLRQVTLTRRP